MTSIFDSAEFNQNLFFPRHDGSPPPNDSDEIYIEVEDSVQIHARRFPSEAGRFSLLYFHGNGEIVADYNDFAELYQALGAELIVCDYRGYGKSGGIPTLRTVLKDAQIIYNSLKESRRLLETVCVMGRSLGSACVIELCVNNKEISCCVIESGYADPVPLVERRGLKIDKITPEESATFNNSEKIFRLDCPLLIMHGAEDNLIGPSEAELNFKNAGSENKQLKILDGVGHNDILMAPDYGYFNSLKKFFDEVI